jgi:hypothetical protein
MQTNTTRFVIEATTIKELQELHNLPPRIMACVVGTMDYAVNQEGGPDHGDLERLDEIEEQIRRQFGTPVPSLGALAEDAFDLSVDAAA